MMLLEQHLPQPHTPRTRAIINVALSKAALKFNLNELGIFFIKCVCITYILYGYDAIA